MKVRGYMAASADGFIADAGGGVDWLTPFQAVEAGYDAFIAGIGTVIFGRATFDQTRGFPGDWAFADKRSIVVTSRPIDDPPKGVEAWGDGVAALIKEVRADKGDAWVIGGAALQAAFIEADALDTLDLFVVPVLLGDGVRMFPRSRRSRSIALTSAETLGRGMVRLSYSFAEKRG